MLGRVHPANSSLLSKRAVTSSLIVLGTMRAEAAHAAKPQKHTEKAKKILEYQANNPMKLESRPMIYDSDPPTPLPDVCVGLTPNDVKPSPDAHPHWAIVCTALLYAACGGLDHSHNLVTPLSWGAPTSYGGPPIRGSPAAKEAAYVHAITHRMEGLCDGEFGDGYSNSNYWYSAAGPHEIQGPLLEKAREYASGSPRLEQLISNHGDRFSPHKFVSICQQADISKDQELKQFCEKVANTEWRMLFDHAHARM